MSKSILIADREVQTATRMYEFLSSRKYKVVIATSGRETIDALHNYIVDAMVLDSSTTIMPPEEFLLKIRLMKFRAPCILVGEKITIENQKLPQEIGPLGQLKKPIDLLQLADSLQAIIDNTTRSKTELRPSKQRRA